MSSYDTYTSPLAARNASEQMLQIWSPRHKFQTWRRIWLAVAEAQLRMATTYVHRDQFELPVTQEQVAELRVAVERGISDEELKAAEGYEKDLRHDVMAHVHSLGDSCPKARPIIHLGMTSQDVVCNADWVVIVESLHLTYLKLARTIIELGEFGRRQQDVPTLAFTHYQPAQPTTIGRRAVQWGYELSLAASRLQASLQHLLPRGFKGATGTQASFMSLFEGDSTAVELFEESAIGELVGDVLDALGRNKKTDDPEGEASGGEGVFGLYRIMNYDGSWLVTSQTYPRVLDTFILADLASVASVLHKIATDIRLLSNRKEIDEPFGEKQIGSSAMPYKRNPMRCERICGLTRFVMNLVGNAYDTAATQWLERTLDDSSNRRLSLPESFLALDGALDIMHNVASGLVVHEAMVSRNLMAELPFLATENILMAAVKAGGDRQDLHERIRVHSQAAGSRVKDEGLDNDLIERLKGDEAFGPPALKHALDWSDLLDPMKYIGRSVEQTERFIRDVVEPLREEHGAALEELGASEPRV